MSSNSPWSSLIFRLASNHVLADLSSLSIVLQVIWSLDLGNWFSSGSLKADVCVHAIVENPGQLQNHGWQLHMLALPWPKIVLSSSLM